MAECSLRSAVNRNLLFQLRIPRMARFVGVSTSTNYFWHHCDDLALGAPLLAQCCHAQTSSACPPLNFRDIQAILLPFGLTVGDPTTKFQALEKDVLV